jgi:hypothetical protein
MKHRPRWRHRRWRPRSSRTFQRRRTRLQ